MSSPDLRARFGAIVGAANVRPAEAGDRVDSQQPKLVVMPGTAEEAGAVLKTANVLGLAVVPRGGGTKLGWGNLPARADLIVSTARLNQLIEHAHGDMTAIAEAGITLQSLQQSLAQHGQMLALDPPWPERATLGGLVATDSSGPLRVRYGTLRDLLIGISVALADGTTAKGGGKVVKNVAGYDLMKLFNGSLGSLGVITTVTLRLHPLPASTGTLRIDAGSAQAAQELILHLNQSPLTPTGVQIVTGQARYVVDVRFSGIDQSVAAQQQTLASHAASIGLSAQSLDVDASTQAWQTHTSLYGTDKEAIVARLAVLPTNIAGTIGMIEGVAARLGGVAHCVIYANGTGLVRLAGAADQALVALAGVVRSRIAEQGGNVVFQEVPASAKERLDVWGTPGDALALMHRIKSQFDPKSTLNPGRYLGRI